MNAVRLAYQLEVIAKCNHGSAMAVLCRAYLRCICAKAMARFARFAEKLWGIERKGCSEADMAALAIKALENFIREIGLPAQLRADAYSLMAAAPRMPGFWQALGRMLHSFAHTGAFSLWACMSARTGLP